MFMVTFRTLDFIASSSFYIAHHFMCYGNELFSDDLIVMAVITNPLLQLEYIYT